MKLIKLKALSCILLTSVLSSCSTQEVSIFDPLILNTYDTSVITDDNGIRLKEGIKKNFLDEDNNHLYEGNGVCVHESEIDFGLMSQPSIDFFSKDRLTMSLRVEKNILIDETVSETNFILFKIFPGYFLPRNYILDDVNLDNFYIGTSFLFGKYDIDNSSLIRINDFDKIEKYESSIDEEHGIYNDCYINYYVEFDYLNNNDLRDKKIYFYLLEYVGDESDVIIEESTMKVHANTGIRYEIVGETVTFKYPTSYFYS